MQKSFCMLAFCAMAALPATAPAMVSDSFDGGTLNPAWTFADSTPAGTTYTLNGSHLTLTPSAGSDLWTFVDSYGYIQQNAPTGENWEVVVKIDNYDPTVLGQQRDFCRTGIQIWQDNDHHMTLSLLANGTGVALGTNTFWQAKPNPTVPDNNENYWRTIDIFGYGPQPSYWIKLQRTTKGYQGFISSDNVNWLNFSPIVRNPETADGAWVNPKIRLFGAGGFGEGTVTPIQFDSVTVTTIPAPTAGYQNDEFNTPNLASNWGFHPGIGVGSYLFDSGALMLTGGVFGDLWETKDQNTYVYQDAPTFNSYNLTVKVAPTDMLPIPYELWNSYGLMLWRDGATFAFISNQRGEAGAAVPNNRIEYGFKSQGTWFSGAVLFGTGLLPEYLRIEKANDIAKLYYSFDNTSWTKITEERFIGASNQQVRLFTKRANNNGTPVDAQFDWVRAQELTADVPDWQIY